MMDEKAEGHPDLVPFIFIFGRLGVEEAVYIKFCSLYEEP